MPDLIDRDAVLRVLWEMHYKAVLHGDFIECKGLALAIDAVDAAKAVDVEPVRHGRWRNSSLQDVFQCSCCKKPTKMDMYCNADTLRDFCPNCGAKMDKED